jgi:hypothetical protein
MSYVIPGGLPSLAHPLIGNAALGSRNSKSGICRPPFPEIDLSWDGFTLSHLHWIGIKDTYDEPHWQYGLFIQHELFHNSLGVSPFSQHRKSILYGFSALIDKTFENGIKRRKPIPVPIRYDRGRNDLEKLWKIVVDIHEASELVEEIYAVRSSLKEAEDVGDINPDDQRSLIRRYKRAYGRYIEGFKKAYDAFDFMARTIGEDAAKGLIYCAFETLRPNVTFLCMLCTLCGLDLRSSGNRFRWTLSKKKTDELASLSTSEACNVFGKLIEVADSKDFIFKRKFVLEMLPKLKAPIPDLDTGIAIVNLLVNPSPKAFLLSYYGDVIYPFVLRDLDNPGNKRTTEQMTEDYYGYGNPFVFTEAIRQQLTQGKGLLCPYWDDERQVCCYPGNKVFLENVWSCTSPDAECKQWSRLGCLK